MKKLIVLSVCLILIASVCSNAQEFVLEQDNINNALNEKNFEIRYKLLHKQLKIYQERYKVNPNDVETLKALGKIYSATNQYGEAKSHLMHLYNLHPESPTSHIALGDFYFHFKEYNTALEFYKLALSSGYLKDLDTNYKTAITYEKLGDLENAKLYYDVCLYLNPDFEQAKVQKELLNFEGAQTENHPFEMTEEELSTEETTEEEIENIINSFNAPIDEILMKKPKKIRIKKQKNKTTDNQQDELTEVQ